jgi:NAD(P)-dependent dehydrogenase (short-subunit alcohol dehydrogenase family)
VGHERARPTPFNYRALRSGRTLSRTGAAQGIGAAIARRLAEAGADLFLVDIDERRLCDTREALKKWGTRIEIRIADVAQEDALTAACKECIELFEKIDIWVNNAGIAPRSPILEISSAEWDKVLDLNLRGAFIGAKCAARIMVERRRGVIINIASSTIQRVSGNPVHYRVSKAGLVALTQSLAIELGASDIRVLAIAPTLTATPLVEHLRNTGLSAGLDEFARRLPLKRVATADEVARVVLFAVSDMAAFMTGSVLTVDGGETHK